MESLTELPNLRNSELVFADFETTSCDPTIAAVNPWFHCWPAGIAITADRHRGAWYVPVSHTHGINLPEEDVANWWNGIVDSCKMWVNHNIKFDAHVSANGWGVLPECPLFCTLTHAKIIDSDRIMRGGYGLTSLSKDWLNEDIFPLEQALHRYVNAKNKDYGRIPSDVCGEYACQDVITTRRLYHYETSHMQAEWKRIWDTETDLTYVLFEMERHGIRVDPQELLKTDAIVTMKLIELMEQLFEKVGWTFRPNVNEDCYEVLCGKHGLPVMGWTDSRPPNPSFDKEALIKYLSHPYAPHDIIKLILEFRTLHTWQAMFLKPYQELHIDGQLHPTYNQCVRTGRLSCSQPNQQQLNSATKKLIYPDSAEHSFMSADYSQIEFRTIVHYIKDERAIAAYQENPDTDFHQWVADICEIGRKPAKTINFLMGYGGGKDKLISALTQIPELIADIAEKIKALPQEVQDAKRLFGILARKKGEGIYQRYHDELPGIRRTSYRASQVLESRGHVNNVYGRPRRLPVEFSYRAFNTLNQSSAADIQKERMVAVSKMLRGTPITIRGLVHDESLFHGPTEVMMDPRTQYDIIAMMEAVDVGLRVPIRASFGVSAKNWYEAAKGNGKSPIGYPCEGLKHLK